VAADNTNTESKKSKKVVVQREAARVPRFSDLPLEARHQFEKLKSSVILQRRNQEAKSILFSSYNHGEGTSTIVLNFAESLAEDRNYNILIVDANTRTPCLHEIVNLHSPCDNVVFSDILTQQVAEAALPRPSAASNLCLVPSGTITAHPSQIFDHTQFQNFVDRVTKLFDFVIFDSSPIGQYYDSIVLASHVDGVMLIVQAEKTPFHEVRRAKQMLEDKNISTLGVILNRRRFRIPQFIFRKLLR